MSGPWFYVIPVVVNGGGSIRPGTSTDLHFYPGSDIALDSPITSKSWVWASIAEISSDEMPFLGDAPMWVANVIPEDDGGIRVRVFVDWQNNLRAQLKLLFWT